MGDGKKEDNLSVSIQIDGGCCVDKNGIEID